MLKFRLGAFDPFHNLLLPLYGTLAILLLTNFSSFGQQSDTDYWRVFYANDFFRARDLYYTQGVRIERYKGPWSASITREGYTPSSISIAQVQLGDHPYSGLTYLEVRKRWAGKHIAWEAGSLVGLIGPLSGGKQEQTGIHRLIDDEIPQGWDNQIRNAPLLDVQVRGDIEVIKRPWLSIELGGLTRLGTFRTRVQTHGTLAIGLINPRKLGSSDFSLAYVVAPMVYVVGYDATLQGGVFRSSDPYVLPSSEVKRVVGRVHTRLVMRWGKFGSSFGHTYETRRFDSAEPHAWGELAFLWYADRTGAFARRVWGLP